MTKLNRGKNWLKQPVLTSLLCLVGACSDVPLTPIYSHDQCNRLKLIDAGSDMAVLGAEDMTKLHGGDLLVSAYNRRGKLDDGTPPEGGLFIIPASALNETEIKVTSLIKTLPNGLRPHGIDAVLRDDGSAHVAFVNRDYERKQSSFVERPSLVRFDWQDNEIRNLQHLKHPAYCRANDVLLVDEANTPGLHVTLDREQCRGFAVYVENMTGASKGRLARFLEAAEGDEQPFEFEADDLSFPNGLGIQFKDQPLGDDNFMVVAETRAQQLRYFPKTDRRDRVTLNGSPDNLTVGKPGIIQVAVHPSLLKLALYRYGWTSFAPSRVQKVTGNQVLTLFDDPTGNLYSAASIAVQTAGKLVIGSVGDEGLLVCHARSVE